MSPTSTSKIITKSKKKTPTQKPSFTNLTMTMHAVVHPGVFIRKDCLEPLEMTITDAAKVLGVTRKALSDLLNEHAGISPDMAMRLEKAGWSTAKFWMQLQLQYELWHAQQRAPALKVGKFPTLKIG